MSCGWAPCCKTGHLSVKWCMQRHSLCHNSVLNQTIRNWPTDVSPVSKQHAKWMFYNQIRPAQQWMQWTCINDLSCTTLMLLDVKWRRGNWSNFQTCHFFSFASKHMLIIAKMWRHFLIAWSNACVTALKRQAGAFFKLIHFCDVSIKPIKEDGIVRCFAWTIIHCTCKLHQTSSLSVWGWRWRWHWHLLPTWFCMLKLSLSSGKQERSDDLQ